MRAGGPSAERRDEAGETLIETLVTMILMGLAVVGILAGLVSVARLSSVNSRTTHVRNSAQSYAELLKQPVETWAYVACADETTYPAIDPDVLPDGYTAEIIEVQHAGLVPNGSASNITATWGATCQSPDKGLQRIIVEVEIDGGLDDTRRQTVAIVKRDAVCSHTYQNVDQGPC